MGKAEKYMCIYTHTYMFLFYIYVCIYMYIPIYNTYTHTHKAAKIVNNSLKVTELISDRTSI